MRYEDLIPEIYIPEYKGFRLLPNDWKIITVRFDKSSIEKSPVLKAEKDELASFRIT